jgi:hypothetical protein
LKRNPKEMLSYTPHCWGTPVFLYFETEFLWLIKTSGRIFPPFPLCCFVPCFEAVLFKIISPLVLKEQLNSKKIKP